ncbi:MAG TPA: YheU family protein [Oligoflexia bacterium]|nr:YheU family protein [Oligoflexia bacterium]HMP48516.1 YheU family protein [Oligoflexia bacterium]
MTENGIPIDQKDLSSEALLGIIKDFILRDGTDYGMTEFTIEEKIGQVRQQIDKGSVLIFFDTESETCTLVKSDSIGKS